MESLSQKRKTGNTPTGPKKVKSKFLLGECCFFALMRVAFKSRALRARFAKVGFSNCLHGCVGCAGWPKLISVLIKTVCFWGPKPQSARF